MAVTWATWTSFTYRNRRVWFFWLSVLWPLPVIDFAHQLYRHVVAVGGYQVAVGEQLDHHPLNLIETGLSAEVGEWSGEIDG